MKNGKSPDGDRVQPKDLLVSIILSESTNSLLNLNVPNIEEEAELSDNNKCIIHPVHSSLVHRQTSSIFSNLFRSKAISNVDDNCEITVEMAYFSDHFLADSGSTTDLSSTENDNSPMIGSNLKARKVFVKPLLNAKTAAHEDKIVIENNEIIVNLIEEDACSVNSELMCRICHGGESLGDLLSPCRCKGSIALAHIDCLERWLKESANSYCELCKHHFRVVRKPKYSFIWSILVYLSQPGDNFRDIIVDFLAFICYTPSALATTYMLMLICENVAKGHFYKSRTISSHLVGVCAIFGMAAIDFTYSSWLIVTFQRHAMAWRSWYRNNSYLKLLLPEHKKRPFRSNCTKKHQNNDQHMVDMSETEFISDEG